MSDHVTQSYHDSDAMAGEPVHRYRSVWMGHWMRTSCKSATQACSNLSIHYESKEEVRDSKKHPVPGGPEIATEIYAKGFREVTKSKAVDIINESLTASSKRLRRESLSCQPFPMFNLSQKREVGVLALKNAEGMHHGGALSSQNDSKSGHIIGSLHRSKSHLASQSAMAPPDTDTLECRFQPGGISQYSEQQVKSHKDLEMNSLAVSTSLQDDFMRSSLKIVPHGFTSGRTPLQSLMSRQEEINQSNSIMASKECVQNTNHRSHSTILVHEKKVSNLLDSRTSGKSLLRQKDATLLLHDPSTSSNQQADFVGKQWQNMQNHSGMGLFPSQSGPPEVTQSEKLYHGCYSLPRLPYSVHDVETRLYTTVDSIGGSPRSPSKFSQSTRHFMITEKTNVALSDKRQIFRESTVSTKFKGKNFSELLSLSPDFRFHVQQGVKLQPLESSTESGGQENVRDVDVSVGLKNESSAETDTMDMDAFQENYLPGVASSPSNKYHKGKSPTAGAADASAREEMGGRPMNKELCDINQALPNPPALASPVGCRETSSSRTQSLDVEHLLSHAEQPRASKSSVCPDHGPLGPEPSSRWVKRLKLSSSCSAHGTKSSKMGEASSHEKVNKFSKILKCGTTGSEPTMDGCHGKEQMALDQNARLLRNGEPSSVDSVKKSQYVTLSHPWIRRWCHNLAASPRKTLEAGVVCEPQCSKAPSDEFQKKQFPSIAAVALVGKAMRGFRPCEFRKRGSFVVWNTEGVLR